MASCTIWYDTCSSAAGAAELDAGAGIVGRPGLEIDSANRGMVDQAARIGLGQVATNSDADGRRLAGAAVGPASADSATSAPGGPAQHHGADAGGEQQRQVDPVSPGALGVLRLAARTAASASVAGKNGRRRAGPHDDARRRPDQGAALAQEVGIASAVTSPPP